MAGHKLINSKIFSWAMIAGLPLALWLANSLLSLKHEVPFKKRPEFSRTLPNSPWFAFEDQTAEVAKSRHHFWLSSTMMDAEGRVGVGLKVLENPELFSSLFPGYPSAMAQDKDLWDRYFNMTFSSRAYLPIFEATPARNHLVYTSWTGCFEVFKRYGADVIVIGDSEVYQTMIPRILHDDLQNGGTLKNPRVLNCTSSGMTESAQAETARELLATKAPHPKLLILGYSFFQAFNPNKKRDVLQKYQDEELKIYRRVLSSPVSKSTASAPTSKKSFSKAMDWNIAQVSGHPTWNDVMPISISKLNFSEESLLTELRKSGFQAGELVPQVLLKNPEQLDAWIGAHLSHPVDFVEDVGDTDCALPDFLSRETHRIQIFNELAAKTFLYLLPANRVVTDVVGPCYLDRVSQLLPKLASTSIEVRTAFMKDYGLTYADFMIDEAYWIGIEYIDGGHEAFSGGEKVSHAIASWIAEVLKPQRL